MLHCGMIIKKNLVKYNSSKIYFHSISIGGPSKTSFLAAYIFLWVDSFNVPSILTLKAHYFDQKAKIKPCISRIAI
jgi:hypothetical protein